MYKVGYVNIIILFQFILLLNSILIGVVNYWFWVNFSYGVWKCEIVEWKVENNGGIVMDKMIFYEFMYGFNVFVWGLRYIVYLFIRNNICSCNFW